MTTPENEGRCVILVLTKPPRQCANKARWTAKLRPESERGVGLCGVHVKTFRECWTVEASA